MSKTFHIRPGDPDFTDSKRPDVIDNPALYSPGEPFRVVIEPGITEIGNGAFEDYAGMTSVVIPVFPSVILPKRDIAFVR